MITIPVLLAVLLLFVIAFVALVVVYVMRDTFKAALSALVSALIATVGSGSGPTVSGTVAVHINLGSFIQVQGTQLLLTAGTPFEHWLVAVITLGVVTVPCMILLHLKDRPTVEFRRLRDRGPHQS